MDDNDRYRNERAAAESRPENLDLRRILDDSSK